jgi:hypothetical protein
MTLQPSNVSKLRGVIVIVTFQIFFDSPSREPGTFATTSATLFQTFSPLLWCATKIGSFQKQNSFKNRKYLRLENFIFNNNKLTGRCWILNQFSFSCKFSFSRSVFSFLCLSQIWRLKRRSSWRRVGIKNFQNIRTDLIRLEFYSVEKWVDFAAVALQNWKSRL